MKRLGIQVLSVGLAILTGCSAGRVPLKYYRPGAKLRTEGPVVACRPTLDGRRDRSIDEALDPDLLAAIDKVLHDEIASSRIAREVRQLPRKRPIPSREELADQGVDLLIEPVLQRMVWEVPGYDLISAMYLLTFFAGGFIGLYIYGATKTEAFGHVALTVEMIDLTSGRKERNTYEATASERLAKLDAEEPETKSRLVGKALSSIMERLKSDVAAFSSKLGVGLEERKN